MKVLITETKMKLNKFVLTIALSLLSCAVFAQNVKVTGKVVDEQGEPVISAIVMVEGSTSNGTSTGMDGSYSIVAPANGLLCTASWALIRLLKRSMAVE